MRKKREVTFYWGNAPGKVSWQDVWHLLSDNTICTVSITVWNFCQSSVLYRTRHCLTMVIAV